jgi:DNA topoisomerase-1
MSTLVIVESPTKARTIRGFLPRGYEVKASMGHIRDLPDGAKDVPARFKGQEWARLGVNVAQDFEPLYVVPADKKKVVKELREALRDADALVLATDEDREGESISWHLLQELKPKVPVRRMVFHEITREAIQEALAHTREVDEKLVRAQETRRILDRLVGYTLSPLLWKKIAWGLSAGRVQSVAVRLLVERERERKAFRSGAWWDLKATLDHQGQGFTAELVALGGRALAGSKDFDSQTGQIQKGKDVVLLEAAGAAALRDRLSTRPWVVVDSEEKPGVQRPKPPFTTATFQKAAINRFKLSAREAMRIAQSLYEQGYITYMRTDSTFLSDQAVEAARESIGRLYGRDYLPPKPRFYRNTARNAQEAHEAIRPAGAHFRTPEETGLTGRERDIYDLIWKRTMACQMPDARVTTVTVAIDVEEARFRASGTRIDFAGFRRAYVEGADDPEAALEEQEVILPHLEPGDRPALRDLEALSHATKPPARYTEATLVEKLEKEEVGRPSTYASIIGTILDRGYAFKQGQALVPTFTAIAVTLLLEKHFHHLVELKFTAGMERTLDDIADGKAESLPYLREFFLGKEGLIEQVEEKTTSVDPAEARSIELRGMDTQVRIGRYGPYLQQEENGEATRVSIPLDVPPADLDAAMVETLVKQKREGPSALGTDPASGQPVFLLTGQYGPYVQLGEVSDDHPKPKRMSLPRGVTPDQVTLDQALQLLSLPRLLGPHPEKGGKVSAGLGRFGPYIVHDLGKEGKDYRSLKGEDDVLTVGLPRALELLAQPKMGRGRRAEAKPLRDLGPHPEDQAPVLLFDGKYGPYVKHADLSASLPRGQDPAAATLAQAVELLAARKAMGGGKRKPSPRTARVVKKAKAPAVRRPKAAKPAAAPKAAAKAAPRRRKAAD